MCLCTLARFWPANSLPLRRVERVELDLDQSFAPSNPILSFGHQQQPTKVGIARIMEDSPAASPTPVEAAAAPNPATEAPAAPLPAPEAGPEASALPAGATVAPPRFDLHAAPDANLNLRLSPSEDGWGGALAFGGADDPLPLADVPGYISGGSES